jgi:hypothetical protein
MGTSRPGLFLGVRLPFLVRVVASQNTPTTINLGSFLQSKKTNPEAALKKNPEVHHAKWK